MSTVALVTDSTAYLPPEYVERYRITVVPLYVRFGDQVLLDGVEITPEQFYARLPQSPVFPATSQPSAGDFVKAYKRCVESGASAILSIHISSKLSGTVASALLAQDQLPEVPIHVVDSLSTSMGQGYQVLEAAWALEAGRSIEETIRRVEEVRDRLRILFVVDTLEFLHRGGRIGGAQAFLGSVLNIKPLLSLKDGRIEAVERVRVKRRALQRAIELLVAEASGRPVNAAVIHAAAPEEAEACAVMLREQIDCRHMVISELSPVIGTHTGPGTVGIVIYPVEP
ncbi:MAG: DegV family protein [Chloroflexia bacterium]